MIQAEEGNDAPLDTGAPPEAFAKRIIEYPELSDD
jgi:hypothetical protein